MNTSLRHARYLAECFAIGVLFAVAATLVLALPANAQEETIVASVALSSRIPATGHTTPDTVHVVSTSTVPANAVTGTCDVDVTGANNESVHPNSDIIVTSANTVTIHDVEREAGASNLPADGTLVLGDTVTVSVRLGEDGLFSGGTLVVDFACTTPPPPTTVPPTTQPATTTTTAPHATTVPPKPCEDNPATPNNECGLPRTGSNTIPALIAFALLVAGTALVAGFRRDATRTDS